MDIRAFFDTVPWDLVLRRLGRRVGGVNSRRGRYRKVRDSGVSVTQKSRFR
jgi:hypothetical protein